MDGAVMKTEFLSTMAHKIILAVATAGTLGAGGAIISSASINAVQDNRLTTLERNAEQMAELSDKLDETNKNVAVLNERLNQRINADE